MRRGMLALLMAVTLGAAGWAEPTLAQTSEEYQIAVSLNSINQPVFQPGTSNLGVALGTLTARVDGATCTTATLAGATQEVILHIGGSGQPAACSVEGATVTLVDGNGHALVTTFIVRKGTRDPLINLAPRPPHSPEERTPNLLGPMQIIIPASIMAEPVSGPPAEDTIGELLGGSVSAFAGGAFCASADVANIKQDAVLLVGLDMQDIICSLPGEPLTFGAGPSAAEHPIGPAWTVELGTQRTLTMFGAPAIGDRFVVAPTPMHAASPASRDVQPEDASQPDRSSIVPPAAGDAGLVP